MSGRYLSQCATLDVWISFSSKRQYQAYVSITPKLTGSNIVKRVDAMGTPSPYRPSSSSQRSSIAWFEASSVFSRITIWKARYVRVLVFPQPSLGPGGLPVTNSEQRLPVRNAIVTPQGFVQAVELEDVCDTRN